MKVPASREVQLTDISKGSLNVKSLTLIVNRIKVDLVQGENLDVYVAVLLGFIFTILGFFGSVSQDWVNTIIILTLTLLLIGFLKNRYLLQDSYDYMRRYGKGDASNSLRDRTEYDPLHLRLRDAAEVFVIGRHLLGFLSYNKDILLQFAKKGCQFNVLLFDPSINDEAMAQDIKRSLTILRQLTGDCPNRFLVKFAPQALGSSFFAVDIGTSRGLIQVQPHPLFENADRRPHFDLKADEKSDWFEFYKQQIERLWQESTEFRFE